MHHAPLHQRQQRHAQPVARTRKVGKYGSSKYVYPKDTMAGLRTWFTSELGSTLPFARMLYWT
jgi:spore photoproduct lyase